MGKLRQYISKYMYSSFSEKFQNYTLLTGFSLASLRMRRCTMCTPICHIPILQNCLSIFIMTFGTKCLYFHVNILTKILIIVCTIRIVKQFYLKLYCRYEYTRPYMINRIWGLKQLWLQLNGHAWFHLHGLRWPIWNGEGAKFKMKIYVSSGIRTHTTPVHDRKVSALDCSATLVKYQVEHL